MPSSSATCFVERTSARVSGRAACVAIYLREARSRRDGPLPAAAACATARRSTTDRPIHRPGECRQHAIGVTRTEVTRTPAPHERSAPSRDTTWAMSETNVVPRIPSWPRRRFGCGAAASRTCGADDRDPDPSGLRLLGCCRAADHQTGRLPGVLRLVALPKRSTTSRRCKRSGPQAWRIADSVGG